MGIDDDLDLIENKGQLHRDDILFYTTGKIRYAIGDGFIQLFKDESDGSISTMRMELIESEMKDLHYGPRKETVYNYFYGKNPEEWISGASSYESIKLKDIYNDIDLKIYPTGAGMKYDLIVRPGGDPKNIRIRYTGVEKIDIEDNSTIYAESGDLRLSDGPLIVYQEDGTVIGSAYKPEKDIITYDIDTYDRDQDLIIDPLLLASTYLGGNDWDKGQRVKVDALGRPVIAATTGSTDFPTSIGAYSSSNKGETDVVISRMSMDLSSLQVSTYIGGSTYDNLKDLDIDRDGRIFVCGATNSTDFPTTSGSYIQNSPAGRNGFIACLSSDLSSVHYSTFIGGSGIDIIRDIAVDTEGRAYAAGTTHSNDFPTTTGAYQEELNGSRDSFLLKLFTDGSDVFFSTLIGGGEYGEDAHSVVVDEEGYPTIAGISITGDYPTTEGAYKEGDAYYVAFLTRFERDGSALNFSTYLANGTWINSMSLGPENDYFITGVTRNEAGDFPVTRNAVDSSFDGDEEVFLMRFSNDGASNIYTTLLGADEEQGNPPNMEHVEIGLDVAADIEGRAYICGKTDSNRFPITIGGFDTSRSDQDCFLTIISTETGKIEYSTFIGGVEDDEAFGIVLNGSKGMYVVGNTYSNYPSHDFPTTEGSYDTSFNAGYDGFILRFKLDSFIPSEPRSLRSRTGDSYVNISWEAPEDDGGESIEGYKVQRGVSMNTLVLIGTTEADDRTYNDTTATNGVEYLYMIRAFNAVGTGKGSSISAKASTHPGVVDHIFPVPGNHHINLTWWRPNDDGGLTDLTYSVFFGKDQDKGLDLIEEGLHRTYLNITGLDNGKAYYMAVRASNQRGTGPLSEVISSVPLDVPSPPLSLEYDLSPFKVSLRWEAPIEDGGSDNITYRVFSGRNISSASEIEVGINQTRITLSESEIGEKKVFFVKAQNEQGLSKPSETVVLTPLGDMSAPFDLTAEEKGEYMDIQWEAPKLSGGSRNLTYTLFYGDNRSSLDNIITGIVRTSYNLTDVEPGVTYHLKVRANNSHFSGPFSSIVSATPITPPSTVLDLDSQHGDGYVMLTWIEPLEDGGDPELEYEVLMGNRSDLISPWRKVYRTRFNITSLKNGVPYYFAVRALNSKGEGPLSEIVSDIPRSVPSRPRNLDYFEGDSFINLSWDEPMDYGGSLNITYDVYIGTEEDNLTLYRGGLYSRNLNITGLTNGVIYYLYVVAVNEEGLSERSDQIPASPLTYPGRPSLLNLTYTEEGIVINWAPPDDNGGGDVWYYHIYRGISEENLSLLEKVGGSTISFTDTDVREDTLYYYSVSAETSYGEGPMKGPMAIETNKAQKQLEEEDLDPLFLIIPALVIGMVLLLIIFIFIIRKRKRDRAMRIFFEE